MTQESAGLGDRLDHLLAGFADARIAGLHAQLVELAEVRQAVRSDLAAVLSAAPEHAVDREIVAAGLRRRLLRLDEAEQTLRHRLGFVSRRFGPGREGG